jgi:hypothetical protein
MTLRQGGSTIVVQNSNRLIKNIDQTVLWDYGTVAPFLVFLSIVKGRSRETKLHKFEWLKRTGVPRSVESDVQADTGAVVIPFPATEWPTLRATDVLHNTRTGEQVYVNTTPTGSGVVNVSVTRGYAGTTAAAINDADTWLRLGNAQGEWSTSPDLIGTDPTSDYNYVQLIRHPFGASGRAIAIGKASGNIGPDEMAWLKEDTYRDHTESKEKILLWGKKSLNGSRTTTDGLIAKLTASGSDAAAKNFSGLIVSQKRLDDFLYGMFKYSAKDKIALTGSELVTTIRNLAYGKLLIDDATTQYGLRIMTYKSPHGDVKFVHHPYFEQYSLSGSAFFFEPECVTLRGIPGRMNTVLDTGPGGNGIQANDVDGTMYQYVWEGGLQVTNIERCGWAYNMDSTRTTDS